MRSYLVAVAFGLVGFAGGASAFEIGDPENGAKIFRKCAACHQVGPEAKSRVGPALNDIVGALSGQVEGFRRYSKPMLALGEAGHVWTVEELDAFLADPRGFLPKTNMVFRGLKDPQDRADVIAYLVGFSPESEIVEGFSVSDEVLALQGDPEYGAYLSSECVTCHKADGSDDGIPGITGWEAEPFVIAMHAYREKHREHPVMNMIAGRLTDEEIAGLAAYFNGLKE